MRIVSAAFLGATLVAGVTAAPSTSRAAFIFGINGQTNEVVRIDTATGAAAVVGGAYATDTNPRAPNALAYDPTNGRFYFSGGEVSNNLYRGAPGSTSFTTLGSLGSSQVFSGAFAGGDYYFWNEAGQLRSVAGVHGLPGGGGTLSSTLILSGVSIPGGGDFGDIAIRGSTLYASYSTSGNDTDGAFSIVDLTGGVNGIVDAADVQTFTGGGLLRLQLAFAGGELFGVRTGSDGIYSINVANGAATFLRTLTDTSLLITDLATVPLPGALLLFGTALAGLGWIRRRRQEPDPVAAAA